MSFLPYSSTMLAVMSIWRTSALKKTRTTRKTGRCRGRRCFLTSHRESARIVKSTVSLASRLLRTYSSTTRHRRVLAPPHRRFSDEKARFLCVAPLTSRYGRDVTVT